MSEKNQSNSKDHRPDGDREATHEQRKKIGRPRKVDREAPGKELQPMPRRKVGRPRKVDGEAPKKGEEPVPLLRNKVGRPRKDVGEASRQALRRGRAYMLNISTYAKIQSLKKRTSPRNCEASSKSSTSKQKTVTLGRRMTNKSSVGLKRQPSKQREGKSARGTVLAKSDQAEKQNRTKNLKTLTTKKSRASTTKKSRASTTKKSRASTTKKSQASTAKTSKASATKNSKASTLIQSKKNIAKKYKKLTVKTRLKSLRSAHVGPKVSRDGPLRTCRSISAHKEEQRPTIVKSKDAVLKTLKQKKAAALSKMKQLGSSIPISHQTPVVELDTDDVMTSAWLPLTERQPLSEEKRMVLRGCNPNHTCCQQRAVEMFDNCTQWEDPAYLYKMLSAADSPPESSSNTAGAIACGQLFQHQNIESAQAPQAFTIIQQTPGQQQLVLLQQVPKMELQQAGAHTLSLQPFLQGKNNELLMQQAQNGGHLQYELSHQERKLKTHRGRKKQHKARPSAKVKQEENNVRFSFQTPEFGPLACSGDQNCSFGLKKDFSLLETEQFKLNHQAFEQNGTSNECSAMQSAMISQNESISGHMEDTRLTLEPQDIEMDIAPHQYQGLLADRDSVSWFKQNDSQSELKGPRPLVEERHHLGQLKSMFADACNSKIPNHTDSMAQIHQSNLTNPLPQQVIFASQSSQQTSSLTKKCPTLAPKPQTLNVQLPIFQNSGITYIPSTAQQITFRPPILQEVALKQQTPKKNFLCPNTKSSSQNAALAQISVHPTVKQTIQGKTGTISVLSQQSPYQIPGSQQQTCIHQSSSYLPQLHAAFSEIKTPTQTVFSLKKTPQLDAVTQSQSDKDVESITFGEQSKGKYSSTLNTTSDGITGVFVKTVPIAVSQPQETAPSLKYFCETTFKSSPTQETHSSSPYHEEKEIIPPMQSVVTITNSGSDSQPQDTAPSVEYSCQTTSSCTQETHSSSPYHEEKEIIPPMQCVINTAITNSGSDSQPQDTAPSVKYSCQTTYKSSLTQETHSSSSYENEIIPPMQSVETADLTNSSSDSQGLLPQVAENPHPSAVSPSSHTESSLNHHPPSPTSGFICSVIVLDSDSDTGNV